ncbi:tyrosine-type recombinase/integrase [Pontibacillus yanchengensis]|uniref:tyrosine-type recombinase/integrase n=1 Tax=Pontibacillus yanchengensis TaxID=462910 RepID=UPI00136A8CF6|nr:site-specific integrase [Pontibacillus yanchengensis]
MEVILIGNLDEFLLYLEVEQNYSNNTLIGYESDLKSFLHFLEQHKRSTNVDDVNPTIVRRFIQFQMGKAHVSPRSMQRRISCLKSFCNYCLTNNLLSSDFMAGIKYPKSDTKLPVYMNLQELKQLFAGLDKDERPLSLRNEAMIKLLATTGMRKQELISLTWDQLDFYNETIRIFGKKRAPPPPSFHGCSYHCC